MFYGQTAILQRLLASYHKQSSNDISKTKDNIFKRPAFHSEHFRFSEHEKRKDQNNLKPHYKIAPKGAGLPYQICEDKGKAYVPFRHVKYRLLVSE